MDDPHGAFAGYRVSLKRPRFLGKIAFVIILDLCNTPAWSLASVVETGIRSPSPHVERDSRLFRHAALVPWRVERHGDPDARDAGDGANGIFHPARHLARHRTARCGQRHLDGDEAVVVDVDVVDEAELVNVGGNLGVIDRLQRGDDLIGQLVEFGLRKGRGRSGGLSGEAVGHSQSLSQTNSLWARTSASARTSTSSRVL